MKHPQNLQIAVNVRFLLKNQLEGIGVFSFETLKRIVYANPQCQFTFIFDRPYDAQYIFAGNVTGKVLSPPARHPVLWYIWYQLRIKRFLKKNDFDIFISMDGFIPLKCSTKTLAVIHDLAFEHYPNDIYKTASKFYRIFFPKYAKTASRIATVSEFTKNDIIEKYHIDHSRIDVVFNGAGNHFKPLKTEEKNKIKAELTNSADYFVYVGALHQRKNISNLLKAFDRFKSLSASDLKLVLVGRKAWGNDEMEAIYENLKFKNDVIFTGWVSDEKLAETLAASYTLTYLSYFEGFGIPLVEAMKCEVPIITSNKSSLPEVAGEAGIIVDPFNIEEICDAMMKISSEQSLRNDLIEKGKSQILKFSWEKSAELLWNSILKAIG